MAGATKPDPAMLENLDLLLNLEVLQNEKDWNVIQRTGMLKHLMGPDIQTAPTASPSPSPSAKKEQSHEK